MKVTIQFEPGDEVTAAALKFFALRGGYPSIEKYATDQILCALEGEESASGDDYFKKMREEATRD